MNRRYKTLRRVIITGPMSEMHEALNWIYKNDYAIRMSGPRMAASYKMDTTRFKIIAEKVI